MSKKVILHVGANKTGTSSIQRMLVESRAALQDQGWDYPDYNLLHMAHHRLAYSFGNDPARGLPKGWASEVAEIVARSEHRLVFSSELLFRTVNPRRVAQVFDPDKTTVVLYLREHLAYMMSWYAQAIQERNLTASFADYLRLFSQPFSNYLALWHDVFGRENVIARVFDRSQLKGGDSRLDFLQFLEGVDPEKITLPEAESNLSISGNLLFFKKILNNYMTYAEATGGLITDEIGAFAGVQESFRGKFLVSPEEAGLAARLFRADIDKLAGLGLEFAPMPEAVDGHAYPNFTTLHTDFKTIKDIAVRTDKQFLKYTDRWQDWRSL